MTQSLVLRYFRHFRTPSSLSPFFSPRLRGRAQPARPAVQFPADLQSLDRRRRPAAGGAQVAIGNPSLMRALAAKFLGPSRRAKCVEPADLTDARASVDDLVLVWDKKTDRRNLDVVDGRSFGSTPPLGSTAPRPVPPAVGGPPPSPSPLQASPKLEFSTGKGQNLLPANQSRQVQGRGQAPSNRIKSTLRRQIWMPYLWHQMPYLRHQGARYSFRKLDWRSPGPYSIKSSWAAAILFAALLVLQQQPGRIDATFHSAWKTIGGGHG
jgi:hypothetical protein